MGKLGGKRDVSPKLLAPKQEPPGRASEKASIEYIGGRVTPASGATPWSKSDGTCGRFRIEHKETAMKRVPVDTHILEKIWLEAVEEGQLPMVIFTMTSVKKPTPQKWVMVDIDAWLEINGQ